MKLLNIYFKYIIFAAIYFCNSSFFTIFAIEEIPDAVIKISTFHQQYNQKMPWLTKKSISSSGSGFVIEGNLIITNAHVVTYSKYLEISKQNSSKKYVATIKHISHSLDLAMLEVSDKSFFNDITPLQLGDIPTLNSNVQTIGFPMGGKKISVTNGVVSRIEYISYSHAKAEQHLAIQTDAAINPGNSGGPVFLNKLVIGVAFQGIRNSDNIGYMIPTTMIRHFIKDSLDNEINGTPEMGVYFSELPPIMRLFLKLEKTETGVVIIGTNPNSPARKYLKRNDILLAINGYNIDDDASIQIDGLRLPFYEIIERSQYGDKINIKWFRDGKYMEQDFILTKFTYPLNMSSTYDSPPEYFIFSGLTFRTLNGDYLRSFGKEWWSYIPHKFRLLYFYQTLLNKEPDRESYLVLSNVLEHPRNSHALKYTDQIIDTINGEKILSFKDLKKSIHSIKSGFYEFKFLDNPMPLIFSYNTTKEIDKAILATNQITKLSNINWKEN